MTTKSWIVAGMVALALVFAAFVYNPGLFGFYGFSSTQCFFMYAADAPTATQARWAGSKCREAHTSSARRSSTRRDDEPVATAQRKATASGRNLFEDENRTMDDIVSDALGIPVRSVFRIGNETWPDRPPLLDSPLASDAMRNAIENASSNTARSR